MGHAPVHRRPVLVVILAPIPSEVRFRELVSEAVGKMAFFDDAPHKIFSARRLLHVAGAMNTFHVTWPPSFH